MTDKQSKNVVARLNRAVAFGGVLVSPVKAGDRFSKDPLQPVLAVIPREVCEGHDGRKGEVVYVRDATDAERVGDVVQK